MTSGDHEPVPTEIQLHQKSRVLEIGFDDGARFRLPVEYLRVFSPAAEMRTARQRGEFLTGKESVNITQITPVGSYAVQLHFDDGHETGLYAWKTLYELGRDLDKQWPAYLVRVASAPSDVVLFFSLLFMSVLRPAVPSSSSRNATSSFARSSAPAKVAPPAP